MKMWVAIFLVLTLSLTLAQEPTVTDPVTLTWTPPSEYEDGVPLTLEELERYELGCGPAEGDRESDVRTWIAEAEAAERTESFSLGAHWCALRVRSITTDEQTGEWSAWSGEVAFLVVPPVRRPMAPTDLAAD